MVILVGFSVKDENSNYRYYYCYYHRYDCSCSSIQHYDIRHIVFCSKHGSNYRQRHHQTTYKSYFCYESFIHSTNPTPITVATSHSTSTTTTTPIKHIVVIFQENISFDHYFGYLSKCHKS